MAEDKQKNGAEEPKDAAGSLDLDVDDLESNIAASMAVENMEESNLEAQMATAMAEEPKPDGDGEMDDSLEQMTDAVREKGGYGEDEEEENILSRLIDDEDGGMEVQPVEFDHLHPTDEIGQRENIDRLMDITLNLSVELGRKNMQIKEILELGPGKIIELDKLAGEPVDLLVNGRLLARGEVVVVDENFGVRITDLVNPKERIQSLH